MSNLPEVTAATQLKKWKNKAVITQEEFFKLEEVVEELLRQRDEARKQRDELQGRIMDLEKSEPVVDADSPSTGDEVE